MRLSGTGCWIWFATRAGRYVYRFGWLSGYFSAESSTWSSRWRVWRGARHCRGGWGCEGGCNHVATPRRCIVFYTSMRGTIKSYPVFLHRIANQSTALWTISREPAGWLHKHIIASSDDWPSIKCSRFVRRGRGWVLCGRNLFIPVLSGLNRT